jgi:hypothetical protein
VDEGQGAQACSNARTVVPSRALTHLRCISELSAHLLPPLGFSQRHTHCLYPKSSHCAHRGYISRGLLFRHSCYEWLGFSVDEVACSQKSYIERFSNESHGGFARGIRKLDLISGIFQYVVSGRDCVVTLVMGGSESRSRKTYGVTAHRSSDAALWEGQAAGTVDWKASNRALSLAAMSIILLQTITKAELVSLSKRRHTREYTNRACSSFWGII